MVKRETPKNIEFSSKILRFPSLRDMGIDKNITVRMIVESKFVIGDWVDRNEEIVTITVELYEKKKKPKYSFKSDRTTDWTFSFKSPLSGLVIGYKQDYLVEKRSWDFSLFGQKNVFPVLLTPKHEPPMTDINSIAYTSLWKTLNIEWPRIHTWSESKGNVRLGEIYTQHEIKNSINQPVSKMELEEFSEVKDKTYEAEWWNSTDVYTATIEHLRANNIILRDKLFHLVKDNY